MKSHVFVSYSSQDRSFVQALASDLKNSGLEVWLDATRLAGGDSLTGVISNAIHEAAAVIAVLSAHSVQSRWVLKEIELAVVRELATEDFRVIPVLLGPIEVPSLLSGKVQVDFGRSRDYRSSLSKLLRALGMADGKEEPEDYGLAFLQKLTAALNLLPRYLAPNISEKMLSSVRESCQIPNEEKIHAVIPADGMKIAITRGKQALAFTDKGIYGASYERVGLMQYESRLKLRLNYREFKKAKVEGYESRHYTANGHGSYTLRFLKIGEFEICVSQRDAIMRILELIQTF